MNQPMMITCISEDSSSKTFYFKYDVNVATSYKQLDIIDSLFGDSIISTDEDRNSSGILQGFVVKVSHQKPLQ